MGAGASDLHENIEIPESGGKAGGNDFLNARLGSVCGTKWEDWNLDRKIGSGDGPVSGWGVDLYIWDDIEEEWVLIAATSTDANGKYCFCNLDPYKVYKVARARKEPVGCRCLRPTMRTSRSPNRAVRQEATTSSTLGWADICGKKWEDINLNKTCRLRRHRCLWLDNQSLCEEQW